jgi:hypothetical protein
MGASQAWVSEVERGKDNAQIGKVLRTLAYLGVKLQTGGHRQCNGWMKPSSPGASAADAGVVRESPAEGQFSLSGSGRAGENRFPLRFQP